MTNPLSLSSRKILTPSQQSACHDQSICRGPVTVFVPIDRLSLTSIALILAASLAGCATVPTERQSPAADTAQLADVAMTAGVTLSGLATEMNPLLAPLANPAGFPVMALGKLALNRYALSRPPESCRHLLSISTGIGWGAVAGTICGTLLGPAGIACLAPVYVATKSWAMRGPSLESCYGKGTRLADMIILAPPSASNPDPDRIGFWEPLRLTRDFEGKRLYQAFGVWPAPLPETWEVLGVELADGSQPVLLAYHRLGDFVAGEELSEWAAGKLKIHKRIGGYWHRSPTVTRMAVAGEL